MKAYDHPISYSFKSTGPYIGSDLRLEPTSNTIVNPVARHGLKFCISQVALIFYRTVRFGFLVSVRR